MKKKLSYFTCNRTEMLSFIPDNCKTVIDIGCGAGKFGEALKRLAPERIVHGIEIDYNAATEAKKYLDAVYFGDLESIIPTLQLQYYDCIIFNDVLEHLINPNNILSRIKNILANNGIVVGSLPNFLEFNNIYRLLKTRDFKYEDSGILDATHLRFFTKKSMLRLFIEQGFEVLNITGINKTSSCKVDLLNFFLLNKLQEFKYLQFAIVAKKR